MNNIITLFCAFLLFERSGFRTKDLEHIFLLFKLNLGLQFTNGIIKFISTVLQALL